MRKSRISFSITKKASKNEGSEANQQVSEVAPLLTKEATLKPSSYYACRFCCKRFKSEKTYETHRKSKNHKKAVATGSTSEQKKSRSCAGCHQSFDTRLQLTEHCTRFSHMPLVQKTALRNPEYGKAYTVNQQEDPFVSIKYYSPYYCEVCDLDCVSDTHYQDHVKGSRHQKALEKRAEQGSGVLVDLDTHEVDVTDMCLVIMNKIEPVTETVSAYYCGICDTDCRSELAYTEHVTSKDHQIRMDGHGQIKISCDLCCMTFTSENNHKMHLKSKKHANNEAARQRLLPLEVQAEAEKGESVQDLRNKIKRTLSPTLENFDKIKVNVATVGSQESAVRSVMVTDDEIEREEAQFMEMGKPNVGSNKERKIDSKKNIAPEKKLKEDELERGKWAKKKEEDYARRKAESEKSKELRATSPRSRGRGGSQRRGRGRGRGRFGKDDKFSWVNPLFDENGKRKTDKDDKDRDRNERRSDRKSDKRDIKSDRRERRRSYERDVKKRDSDSEEEYKERVILKKGERKRDRSSSKEDDLRKVINKQRGQDTSQNSSDEDYVTIPTGNSFKEKSEEQSSLVFDYGHKHMERGMEGNTREDEARAGLKGFFGGALSDYFEVPGNEAQKGPARQGYYGDQRSMTETSLHQDQFERGPPPEAVPEKSLTTEKTLLLELLKRQFPDIRYLTEQQGGLELMQRIFGEMQGKNYDTASDSGTDGAGLLGADDAEVGGGRGVGVSDSRGVGVSDSRGVGVSDSRGVTMGGGDGGEDGGMFGPAPPKSLGGGDGRKVYAVGDLSADVGMDRRVVADDGVKIKTETALVAKSQSNMKRGRSDEISAKEKDSKFASKKTPDARDGRVGKKESEKSGTVDKRRDRGRSRSRSKERRRRSRSRSGSRGRSRYQSKYSSRKRSRSSSRDRSSSKRTKRTPSPARGSKKDDARSSTKRKGSVSPKRGDKQKAEVKSTVVDDKKGPQKQTAVSQTKAKSKDAKEKVLAKWTVSNWLGKEGDAKAEREKEESADKGLEEKDKKEKGRDRKDVSSSGKERRKATTDRGEEVSKQGLNRGKRESIEKSEMIKSDTRDSQPNKIFDDASDYEELMDVENEDRSLKAQFEDDYDEEPVVERRPERVSERGSRSSSRESSTARLGAVLAETMARLGRTVPRIEEVRKSIPLVSAAPDADYDPYSYEERAFKAQEVISDEPPMSLELLTQLALHYERLGTGPPYPPVTDFLSTPAGMALSRQQTMIPGSRQGSIPGIPRSMVAGLGGPTRFEQVGGIDPRTGLPLGGGLVANSPSPGIGLGTSAIRGTNIYGGGFPGSRNSSALKYIQPTEGPLIQGRQLRAIPDERLTKSGVRPATSQSSVVRGSSDKNIPKSSSSAAHSLGSLLQTTPRTVSPILSRATQQMGLSGSARHDQVKKRELDSGDDEPMEDDFTRLSDSDQYGNESTTSKPLKSILKKQSKFPAVEVPSQPSDIQVPISSGNLPPKNAVGAEYVVQNTPQSTGEQGRYFCQLCDVQFTTLSAKNLHLRGPKHLAMFMKHKTPLIDEMIEQAMGGTKHSSSPPAEENEQKLKEPLQAEIYDLPLQDWRRDSPSQEQKQTEVKASHTVSERAEPRGHANKPREAEEKLDRGYPTDITFSEHSRDENEPRLYVDEKTGRFVQARGYYSDSLKDEETTDEYEGKKYSETTIPRARDNVADNETGVVRKEDYFSRDTYDQLAAREKDLSRDEYGRLVSGRGYPAPRDSYDRREGSPPRQEYGRPPARDTLPGDYGRLAPLRTDLPLDDYEYSPREKRPMHDDYRRVPTREPPLSREDYSRGLTITDEYGGRLSRESYAGDKDWRSDKPLMRERSGEQSRDWSYGEPRPGVKETGLPTVKQPDQRVESVQPTDNTQGEWPTGTREEAKKVPQREADESWEKRADETRAGEYLTPVEEAEPRELADQRQDTRPERYPRDYESRPAPEDSRRVSDDRWDVPEDTRRAPDDGYSQPLYRGQYDGGYGDRYSGREAGFDRPPRNDRREQSGYGYDAPRRGRGARGGRGGSGRARGFPKKPGFNRGQRQGWKGGQGRY